MLDKNEQAHYYSAEVQPIFAFRQKKAKKKGDLKKISLILYGKMLIWHL